MDEHDEIAERAYRLWEERGHRWDHQKWIGIGPYGRWKRAGPRCLRCSPCRLGRAGEKCAGIGKMTLRTKT